MIGSLAAATSLRSAISTERLARLAEDAAGLWTTHAALLWAPEAGEGHEVARTFLGVPFGIWQVVNLVLFLALLVHFLRKPLATFFTERRTGIEQSLKAAEEKRIHTEALATEITARMGRIEVELAELRAHAQREADAEQAELTAQTEADAARIVARASAEIESRVRTARQELTSYAADLAVEIAEELLKKNLTPEDQKRFLREGVVALNDLSPQARGTASPKR